MEILDKLSALFNQRRRGKEAQKALFEGLYKNHFNLVPDWIFFALFGIHKQFGIPKYPLTSEKSLWLSKLLRNLSESPDLKQSHVPSLVQMLFWNELREEASCRIYIIRALGRFPTASIIPQLLNHRINILDKVEKEKNSSRNYTDLKTELKSLNELIEKCELWNDG